MADQPTTKGTGTQADSATFNPSATTITAQDYQTVKSDLENFKRLQLSASNEFMYQHYARLIRAVEVSYERATKANIVLERKQRRAESKQRREALKKQRSQAR